MLPPLDFCHSGAPRPKSSTHETKAHVPELASIPLDIGPLDEAEISSEVLTPRTEPIPETLLINLENRGLTSHHNWPTFHRTKPTAIEKTPAQKQAESIEFWSTHLLWKSTVAAKLREVGQIEPADALDHCRSEASVKRCTNCKKVTIFWNRCDRMYCPACTPRLSRERKESVQAWSEYIGQPKHVVLTCRNTGDLTKERVQWFKACFSRLRRSKFATQKTSEVYASDIETRLPIERYSYPWIGGFYSLEVTKERNGWHLHLHALVDARFIDSVMLARVWAHILGQDVAVCKVMDAREKSYLQEVVKYVVKGDTLALWSGHDIATFIHAFDGVRSFGVFGTLYKRRSEFKAALEALQADIGQCDCGCNTFEIMSPSEFEWQENAAAIPPPLSNRTAPAIHPEFKLNLTDVAHIQALAR